MIRASRGWEGQYQDDVQRDNREVKRENYDQGGQKLGSDK